MGTTLANNRKPLLEKIRQTLFKDLPDTTPAPSEDEEHLPENCWSREMPGDALAQFLFIRCELLLGSLSDANAKKLADFSATKIYNVIQRMIEKGHIT